MPVPGQTLPFQFEERSAAPALLTLIDASGYIFRAYHALPGLTTSKGVPTHAVLGFTRMVLKLLREQQPTHVALCFDRDSRRGRLEIDPQYKANRAATPPDLITQFELIRKVAEVLNLPIIEMEGWEADDVIGTLVVKARAEGFRVRVLTSDKDFVQVVAEDVELYDPVHDRRMGPKEAEAKYEILPAQMRDYLALVGDAIDNVAKVPGVGPKTAVELLKQFGDIESLLARIDEVKKPKLREAISTHAETLRRAKQLVSFKCDLPLVVDFQELARKPLREAEARSLFTELEFFRLVQEMPAPRPTPLAVAPVLISEPDVLAAWAEAARQAGALTLSIAYDGPALYARPEGLALFVEGRGVAFVPLTEDRTLTAVREVLGPVLADPQVRKGGHDLKAVSHVLASVGMVLNGAEGDVELLSYLLNPSRRTHALSDLARERLNLELPVPSLGSGKAKVGLSAVPLTELATCFGAAADAAHRLGPELWREAEQVGLVSIARDMELPLLPLLAKMERTGVRVDLDVLHELSQRVDADCLTQLSEVHRLAGREFNVGSPAQLAQVLFADLNLPVLKRGKTGPSTDQEVLEKLASLHPLPSAIIEYRNLAKLKSTYLDTLPTLVAADGRVHTTFHQVAAATGRLSSSDPNLQNIPIRTELGREIRRAFVAAPGSLLLSADYSQVELRILAHIAGDSALVEAFQQDADVHARTASEVFGVAPEEVTEAHRRTAKMVNYAIAYGLSPHGLSVRLNIPVEEAKSVIDRYFERYSGIRRYLDETLVSAHKSGFVETLFGRRRYLPDLGSKNRNIAMAAERAAINMPIQGTAADLVKMAMLKVDRLLTEQGLRSRMLLQVHDELLFEVPEDELETVQELARRTMSEVADFRVPLKVDVGHGPNWATAH